MRRLLLCTSFFAVTAGVTAGCDTYFFIGDDPVSRYQICEDGSLDCFAKATTTTTLQCEGDPTQDASLVKDDCGVFVKAGAVDGDGTQDKPFGTFADAAKSGAAWVFACEGDYAETEGVVFGGDVAVYGGFTGCTAAWKWSADAKSKLTGPADAIAVSLTGGTSFFTNVDITAADAEMDGGSSIAVLVNGGTAEIRNAELTSGAAKAGAAGESLAADSALDGESGDPGAGVCESGANNPGAAGKMKTCAGGSTSVAGSGGDGGLVGAPAAGSGENGKPEPSPNPNNKGIGGVGEGVSGATECSSGTDGASGTNGGAAGAVSGLGDVSASGYVGVTGQPGDDGKPGQGGGGGGGAKGAAMITCPVPGGTKDRVGAAGGAGGTGGCGGKGGGAGGAGGASIVMLSLSGDVTLSSVNVNLHPGKGGSGGAGGNGQGGGNPGTGGAYGAGAGSSPNIANKSCRGGDGGSGGSGGPGSGGSGGHAIGIAFKGTAPKGGTVVMDNAAPGTGGDGGAGNEAAGKASDGLACQSLDFTKGADSCVP
ncbi:MAG: hypothetical protein U0441_16360 [Polyangiaceae bacterium]